MSFWQILIMVGMGVFSEKTYQWLRVWWSERKTPYRWVCMECQNKGAKFYCAANNVAAVDAMVLAHQRAHDREMR